MSRSSKSIPSLGESCDVAVLSAMLSASRAQRWRPGLPAASHSEVFARGDSASGAAFALALARDGLCSAVPDPLSEAGDRRTVLWVQDRASIRLGGRPYRHGLPADLRHRVIHVETRTPEDALFALEEGLRCRDLTFVIGEIAGNPKALDFTASRRLSLMSEKHGIPLWLVRLDAQADLSSARMRWQAEAAPSAAPQWDAKAPGRAVWNAELFRARTHAPGNWILYDDDDRLVTVDRTVEQPAAPHYGGLARATVGRSLASL